MGETDDYPSWALPLLIRRVLWQQYGIPFTDYEFSDVLDALRLHGLEVDRKQWEADKK